MTASADVDIAIAGGGLTALTAAAVLARAGPEWRIALLADDSHAGAASRGDAFPEVRTMALSASSREVFAALGLWSAIAARSAAITDIQVSERGGWGLARLGPAPGDAPFGQVIENAELVRLLAAAVAACPNVRRASGSNATPVPRRDHLEVQSGAGLLRARLLLVADGTDSPLRAGFGIGVAARDYGNAALIATLTLAEPHRGIAYERFTPDGPMALLPLPDRDGQSRASLVWVLPPERAAALAVAPEPERRAELQMAFGRRAGVILGMGTPQLIPLRRCLAHEQVRSRLVLVGNAAHSLHPVAGQGFNLTVRDLATLAQHLRAGARSGPDLGDLGVLAGYARARARDQWRTLQFSERLPALFASRAPLLALGRNLGLTALGLCPPLRHALADFGAGLAVPAARVVGDESGL
ncbi:MAG: 2-octaprenyl-6-methoxyphenyl hydroxylase [Porticoccaceae bacterium]|nr:MAG: 2-octaprenyl-6-methoxyphenyl hydroxylase [Porticoccaceae bacterium]